MRCAGAAPFDDALFFFGTRFAVALEDAFARADEVDPAFVLVVAVFAIFLVAERVFEIFFFKGLFFLGVTRPTP